MSGDRNVMSAMTVFGPLKIGDCNRDHGCSPRASNPP